MRLTHHRACVAAPLLAVLLMGGSPPHVIPPLESDPLCPLLRDAGHRADFTECVRGWMNPGGLAVLEEALDAIGAGRLADAQRLLGNAAGAAPEDAPAEVRASATAARVVQARLEPCVLPPGWMIATPWVRP